MQPVVNKNAKYAPEPVLNAKLEKIKGKNYRLHWEPLAENVEKQAVKYLIYQFDEGEAQNLNDPSHIIALTGEKELLISKKELKEARSISIIAVSKNNNLSSPVSVSLRN